MIKFSPMRGIFAFVVLLGLISPFAKVVPFNMWFLMGAFAAGGYAIGVWTFQGLKDKNRTVVFMKDSIRKSQATDSVVSTVEDEASKLPGLVAIPFGGFTTDILGVADKSVAIVPKSSVHVLSPQTLLVYAHTTLLKSPKLLKSVASWVAKAVESNTFVSFSTGKHTRSEARIGLLDGLHESVTTEVMAAHDRAINRAGINELLMETAEGGYDAKQDEMVRMVKKLRKKSPMEKAASFVFGDVKTETEASRPNQREPQ